MRLCGFDEIRTRLGLREGKFDSEDEAKAAAEAWVQVLLEVKEAAAVFLADDRIT